MNTDSLHITIIGAGIGGLCLAQSLRQRNISFDVYERDEAFNSRTQGFRLRIDQTGQEALAACLPASLYTLLVGTASRPDPALTMLDTALQPVGGRRVSDWRDDHTDAMPDLKVDRQTLREILMMGIHERVHFNKRFVQFEMLDGTSVRSHFADGSKVTSQVLVAADGIHSRVRDYRFPEAIPIDTGDVCLYGKTLLIGENKGLIADQFQAGTSVIFDSGLAVIVDAMRFDEMPMENGAANLAATPLSERPDYVYWAMMGKRARFGLRDTQDLSCPQEALRDIAKRVAATWVPAIQTLFDLAEPGMLALMAIRSTQAIAPWIAGPVTALGDAIHAMSPASGLGANSALFDAATLGRELGLSVASGRDAIAAIAEYERKMREHSFSSRVASQSGAEQLLGANAC